jgi:hypothetical protein
VRNLRVCAASRSSKRTGESQISGIVPILQDFSQLGPEAVRFPSISTPNMVLRMLYFKFRNQLDGLLASKK